MQFQQLLSHLFVVHILLGNTSPLITGDCMRCVDFKTLGFIFVATAARRAPAPRSPLVPGQVRRPLEEADSSQGSGSLGLVLFHSRLLQCSRPFRALSLNAARRNVRSGSEAVLMPEPESGPLPSCPQPSPTSGSIHWKPKAVDQAGDCRPDGQAMRAQNCAPIPPPRFL